MVGSQSSQVPVAKETHIEVGISGQHQITPVCSRSASVSITPRSFFSHLLHQQCSLSHALRSAATGGIVIKEGDGFARYCFCLCYKSNASFPPKNKKPTLLVQITERCTGMRVAPSENALYDRSVTDFTRRIGQRRF